MSLAFFAVAPGSTALTTAAADSHGFLSPTGVEIAFLLVGLATFGAALVTVTTRQLVHAALWLVVTLGGLAVEYLLLTAEFIAWVQVLIYLGSVVVLLLFGLMLTKAPIGRSPDADSGNRWAALAVAVAAAAALIWVVVDAFRTTWIDLDGAPAGSTEVTGKALFQNWVLPFEALSVLLLAALVGAIVLSRKAKPESSSPPVNSPASAGGSPSAPNSRNHPIGRTRPVPGTQPVRGTQPVAGTQPTAGSRPTAGSSPLAETKPVETSVPTAESKLAETSEPMAESKPVEVTEPTAESKPVEVTDPAAESKPVKVTDPTAEPKPVEATRPAEETGPGEQEGAR